MVGAWFRLNRYIPHDTVLPYRPLSTKRWFSLGSRVSDLHH
jgi:hypothetical protein